MSLVPTEWLEEQLLVNAVAGTPSPGLAGILTGAKIRPYVAPINPTEQTLLADLTVSPDANLAAVAVTWGAQYRRREGGIAIDGGVQLFQLADVANVCIIYGIALLNAAGNKLLGCYPMSPTRQMSDVLDGLAVSPQVALGGPNLGDLTVAT